MTNEEEIEEKAFQLIWMFIMQFGDREVTHKDFWGWEEYQRHSMSVDNSVMRPYFARQKRGEYYYYELTSKARDLFRNGTPEDQTGCSDSKQEK